MKKVFLVVSTVFFFFYSYSQEDTVFYDLSPHKFFKNSFIKIAPVIGGNDFLNGGILSFETGMGIRKWSINICTRYTKGYGNKDLTLPITEHYRFEIHPRYWPMAYFKGPFFCPMIVFYSTGDFSGGIASGIHLPLGKVFIIETFAGLQATTPVEHFDSPVFFRIALNLGLHIPFKKI